MQFSVWPSSARSTDEVLARAEMADTDGWYGFWFPDHYMPNSGDSTVLEGDMNECWAVLPAVAAKTSRIRLGPLVSPTTVHHPAILASRAATLDHVSGGRFVLGIGAGWQINEHSAYGIELPPPGPRVSRFEEAIQIVRSLLADERTTFKGTFYDVSDAPCEPKPLQSPLPILVGTAAPRMLRIAARHADEWNTWGDPDVAADRLAAHAAACEAVGRDPASMRRSAQAMVFFASDDKGGGLPQRLPEGRAIAGSTDEILDAIGRYRDAGFDEFIVPDFHLNRESATRDEFYDRFHTEILPAMG